MAGRLPDPPRLTGSPSGGAGPELPVLRAAFARADRVFDAAFGPDANPLRQLGALGFFFLWLATGTGIYLYVFFDTSVDGAFGSVEALTRGQPLVGGLARSVHRYASDALVLVTALHVARELALGRFAGFRWFSWLTGVPLLWLIFFAGVGGYWLAWDALAQVSAIATLEWIDALGVFAEPLARNFLTPAAMTDRFFALLVFLHIGLPLLLLLGSWVHVTRISRPLTQPVRGLALGTAACLVALSLAHPATSAPAADLDRVPGSVPLDWFYMAVHPALYASSATTLWVACALGTLGLAALPLAGQRRRPPAAVVDLAHCNGCGRCFDDCPYAAVSLVTRTDRRRYTVQPVVDTDLCASCGICVGACPSSTPFGSRAHLATGIDLPRLPAHVLRERLDEGLRRESPGPRVVVFACDSAVPARGLAGADTVVLGLPCAGMLPPSFVDYALRRGADGVLVGTCAPGECVFRLGERWTRERLEGVREPRLRARVPAQRVRRVRLARGAEDVLAGELARFRAGLTGLAPRGVDPEEMLDDQTA